ncbi:MAG TPA: BON domain-containing protein [Blastocatellia bacterium]|nr:BON domain-containing protein [Blastocatellia bacterium]
MYVKPDDQIKQEVQRELRWDTRVEETEVGVTVSKGAITLTGTVGSYARKLAAQEAAFRVHGVLDVANDIQVKLPGSHARTDTEIAKAVRHALEWDVLVPDDHIRSTVSDGWVTLEGDVVTISEREDAERAVRYLQGVKGVHNRIIIKPPEIRRDDVRGVIEEALERRADRLADRIRVSVFDGEVTLSGHVHSWAEKRAVIGAVSHTPGVHAVNDRLLIQSTV